MNEIIIKQFYITNMKLCKMLSVLLVLVTENYTFNIFNFQWVAENFRMKRFIQHSSFLNLNNTVVTAQEGSAAILPCTINKNNGTITWLKNGTILTIDNITDVKDKRYLIKNEEVYDWSLKIRYTKQSDKGVYECQKVINSSFISSFTTLVIIRSYAEIIGNNPRTVKIGSPLRLSCVLRRSIEPPSYIFWYHGQRVINFDLSEGRIRDGRQGSELIYPKAEEIHSGNYSCVPSNAQQTHVSVLVQ